MIRGWLAMVKNARVGGRVVLNSSIRRFRLGRECCRGSFVSLGLGWSLWVV